jgi:putative transposase
LFYFENIDTLYFTVVINAAVALARILIHLIFSTKNREPYFADPAIRKDLHAYLAATANHLGCPAIRIGGVADHVHVVCSLGRTLRISGVSETAQYSL